MPTLSLSVCRKQKEPIVSLRCLYGVGLLIVPGDKKWSSIVHNGNVINMKTKPKPVVTVGRVTSYKAQTPLLIRHTSSQDSERHAHAGRGRVQSEPSPSSVSVTSFMDDPKVVT